LATVGAGAGAVRAVDFEGLDASFPVFAVFTGVFNLEEARVRRLAWVVLRPALDGRDSGANRLTFDFSIFVLISNFSYSIPKQSQALVSELKGGSKQSNHAP
jgi:hypothetical protein